MCKYNEVLNENFSKFLDLNQEYVDSSDEDCKRIFILYWVHRLEFEVNNVCDEFNINDPLTAADISDLLKTTYKLNENNFDMKEFATELKEISDEHCVERDINHSDFFQNVDGVQEETLSLTNLLDGN